MHQNRMETKSHSKMKASIYNTFNSKIKTQVEAIPKQIFYFEDPYNWPTTQNQQIYNKKGKIPILCWIFEKQYLGTLGMRDKGFANIFHLKKRRGLNVIQILLGKGINFAHSYKNQTNHWILNVYAKTEHAEEPNKEECRKSKREMNKPQYLEDYALK